jgi:hypothetical protein
MTKQHTSEQEFIELARNSHLFGCAEVRVDNSKACGQHQDELIQAHREAVQAAEVNALEEVRRGWNVDAPDYAYMSSTIDRLIAARSHNGGE